jgi:hypothetical protein
MPPARAFAVAPAQALIAPGFPLQSLSRANWQYNLTDKLS